MCLFILWPDCICYIMSKWIRHDRLCLNLKWWIFKFCFVLFLAVCFTSCFFLCIRCSYSFAFFIFTSLTYPACRTAHIALAPCILWCTIVMSVCITVYAAILIYSHTAQYRSLICSDFLSPDQFSPPAISTSIQKICNLSIRECFRCLCNLAVPW